MNHDYAHCADYKPDCPKKCWRGELVRDLASRSDLSQITVSWEHFEGTQECQRGRGQDD